MSRVFGQLYLDEDVSAVVAALLRSRGFQVVTTVEAGNSSIADDAQIAYAASRLLVLLTHNRDDFDQLAQQYFSAGKLHAGIIIAVRRQPHDILRRLLALLNQQTADELSNNVWYI